MINNSAQWISAPFAQPRATVAQGHDDSVVIFRSLLLRTEIDGPALRSSLDRMAARAPKIAAAVIMSGSLGQVSYGRAVESLRVYLATGVATAPVRL